MTPLAIDALGVPFALVCVIVWMGFVLVVARICGTNDRLAQGQREELAERLETEHPVTSISEYVAEQEARADRARFRHATRWGRSA